MKYTKMLPYKLKKALPAIGMMGSMLMTTSCEQEKDDYENQQKTIELKFTPTDVHNIIYIYPDVVTRTVSDTIIKYVNDPTVKTIYLVPEGDWSNELSNNVNAIRVNILEYPINYSSKVRGKGDFNFRLGEASKVPEDSLWYVRNGWTINKYR